MSDRVTSSQAVLEAAAPPAGQVCLTDVQRTFLTRQGDHPVLREVTLEIHPGEIIAIVGPSGCGKSTLLRLIGGLDAPTTGTITLDGEAVQAPGDTTAIAFQEPRLLPWRTIAQNVAIGLPRGTGKRAAQQRVAELLELVGLSRAAGQRPSEVSGGMAQRASLARALARNPRVLLLDEPFGALDALTRLNMHDLLLEVHRAQPSTVILVTHDVEEAVYLADRVLMLRNLSVASTTSGNGIGSPATAQGAPEQRHTLAQPRASIVALGSSAGIGASGFARASAGATVTGAGVEADRPDATGSIARLVTVPGARPRDRSARTFTELRVSLLESLGVHRHAADLMSANA